MSDVPRGLKKWYEEAIKEGKRANVRSGFVYILFDRTGLSNDQVKGLSKEDVLRRTRYIGQSKDKSGTRPLKHFAEAIDEIDTTAFSNIKIEAFVNALNNGAELVPFIVFDDIPLTWLNTFEYCLIVAFRYLTMRFKDADLWNISSGVIQPNDKLFGDDPVKQIEFGALLARLVHLNLIAAELEEEEESDSDEQMDVSDDE